MRRWLGVTAGAVAVAVAAAGLTLLEVREVHAARWRVAAEQRPFVERALRQAADGFRESPERFRRLTTPEVAELGDRICVTLASRFDHGGAMHEACFDRRSGSVLSERTSMGHGSASWRDRVLERALGL